MLWDGCIFSKVSVIPLMMIPLGGTDPGGVGARITMGRALGFVCDFTYIDGIVMGCGFETFGRPEGKLGPMLYPQLSALLSTCFAFPTIVEKSTALAMLRPAFVWKTMSWEIPRNTISPRALATITSSSVNPCSFRRTDLDMDTPENTPTL